MKGSPASWSTSQNSARTSYTNQDRDAMGRDGITLLTEMGRDGITLLTVDSQVSFAATFAPAFAAFFFDFRERSRVNNLHKSFPGGF